MIKFAATTTLVFLLLPLLTTAGSVVPTCPSASAAWELKHEGNNKVFGGGDEAPSSLTTKEKENEKLCDYSYDDDEEKEGDSLKRAGDTVKTTTIATDQEEQVDNHRETPGDDRGSATTTTRATRHDDDLEGQGVSTTVPLDAVDKDESKPTRMGMITRPGVPSSIMRSYSSSQAIMSERSVYHQKEEQHDHYTNGSLKIERQSILEDGLEYDCAMKGISSMGSKKLTRRKFCKPKQDIVPYQ